MVGVSGAVAALAGAFGRVVRGVVALAAAGFVAAGFFAAGFVSGV